MIIIIILIDNFSEIEKFNADEVKSESSVHEDNVLIVEENTKQKMRRSKTIGKSVINVSKCYFLAIISFLHRNASKLQLIECFHQI